MSYSEIKWTYFSRGWRLDLRRNTDDVLTINEIDKIYSIEYDKLHDSPVVIDSLMEKLSHMGLGSLTDDETRDIINEGQWRHFGEMVKRNVTDKVWEIYNKRQAEKDVAEVLEKIDEHAEVQRLEKQAEQAFESRLYGQTRRD